MVATLAKSPRMTFTRHRYDAMVVSGVLTKEDQVELLNGEIYQKMPKGPKHSARVKALIRALTSLLQDRAIIGCQDPVALNEFSEPEPDISVLRPRADFYETEHPSPPDVFFLVEVSDTTLGYDRDLKIPLYAACDVPEVWLVDVQARRVIIHSRPEDNHYLETTTYGPGQHIPISAFPGESISVEEMGL